MRWRRHDGGRNITARTEIYVCSCCSDAHSDSARDLIDWWLKSRSTITLSGARTSSVSHQTARSKQLPGDNIIRSNKVDRAPVRVHALED